MSEIEVVESWRYTFDWNALNHKRNLFWLRSAAIVYDAYVTYKPVPGLWRKRYLVVIHGRPSQLRKLDRKVLERFVDL